MIESRTEIKLIRRNETEKDFNLDFSYFTPEGLIFVFFSD